MLRDVLGTIAACVLAWSSAAASGLDQYQAGETGYAENCAACHGEAGRGGPGYANPIWGSGAQIAKYKNAAVLLEYHLLMMPFDDPNRVADDLKVAITQFLLANHGAIRRDQALDPAGAEAIALR